MSEKQGEPLLYRVSYSGRVRDSLLELGALARSRGLGARFVAALQEIDRLLQLYPQFGEPLRDLVAEPMTFWIGVVSPLVVRYCVDESRRLVMVGVPILPLPGAGLGPDEPTITP